MTDLSLGEKESDTKREEKAPVSRTSGARAPVVAVALNLQLDGRARLRGW